ncbi:hypothetical protein BDR05DRAFT_1003829 [Suillus weaverae]|nr:hypothetical protein BDR05DRAFT_1003829 [Suillus weaverae]
MFSTACPPSQCQYVTLNPAISPPALHNARYAGWVRPPIQLPRVAFAINTPSRYPHEVATTNSQPHPYTTHTRAISGAQASAVIMGHVDSQRCNVPRSSTWNGGAYASSLRGASEMPTREHDTGNAWLIYDHSTRRTMPSNDNNTQKARPHPFLAPPSVPLIYDLRYPPTALRFPPSSLFAGCGYEFLRVPLTPERPRQIRLISPNFPWVFDIDPSTGEEIVTCLDVLATLHSALQRPLTGTEWDTAGDDKRASIIRARDRRLRIQLALHRSSSSAARTRPTMSFDRSVQREPLLLRVDWLGSSVAFVGLVRDEAFARSSFVPGGGERPETWVVKFQQFSL